MALANYTALVMGNKCAILVLEEITGTVGRSVRQKEDARGPGRTVKCGGSGILWDARPCGR